MGGKGPRPAPGLRQACPRLAGSLRMGEKKYALHWRSLAEHYPYYPSEKVVTLRAQSR